MEAATAAGAVPSPDPCAARSPEGDVRDRWCALLVGAAAFSVYFATLAPGPYDFVDTPVFQFVGHVLGTAHNPGYPLYALLSHVFVALPLGGTLGWRANLFSAVLAAVAVAVVFAAARRLGAGRLVSAATALSCAFSLSFWNAAIIAEVYALQSLLVSLALVAILDWRGTGRAGPFYFAVAAASLAAANHTSVALAVPALVAYALATDARFALRPRTLAFSAAIVAGGLSIYLYVIWRTLAGAPYLDSQARSLGELAGVVTGRQFWSAFGEAGGTTLAAFERLQVELTRPGLAGAVAGLALLAWRGWREAVLLGFLAACYLSMPFWYPAADWQYMAGAAFVACWLACAVTLQAIANVLFRRLPRRVAAAACVLLVAAIPARLFQRNLAANNLGGSTHASVYFRALFDELPDRVALVGDDYVSLSLARYMLLAEGKAAGRDVRLLTGEAGDGGAPRSRGPADYLPLWREGYEVRLFPDAATQARLDGVPIERVRLPRSAATYAAELPGGAFVVLAVPASASNAAALADLRAAGLGDAAAAEGDAVALVTRARERRALAGRSGREAVTLESLLPARLSWASPLAPAPVRVEVEGEAAAIWLRGDKVIEGQGRPLLAVVHARGYLLDAQALDLESPLRLDVPQPPSLALWRVVGDPQRTDTGAVPLSPARR